MLFKTRASKLDRLEAEIILENIFAECEREPNTVPLEQLESYSSYRNESYKLQIGILQFALVLFIFLPLLFVKPNFMVTFNSNNERGMPEYQIDVSTILPVKSVVAKMNGKSLPVYQVNGHTYTIEPTRNGNVILTVKLFNGQYLEKSVDVDDADSESPELTSIEITETGGIIYVFDSISGVDFESIYAEAEDGTCIYPSFYDEETGQVIFDNDIKNTVIYIYDNFRNVLKLRV